RLAKKHNRSVTAHCIKAHAWMFDVLKTEGVPDAGLMLHGFGGSAEVAKQLANLGVYLSFAGNVLDPKRKKAREAIKVVPEDRLMLETDSPYMIPPDEYVQFGEDPDGKSRNEPANLAQVLPGVADILGVSAEDLSDQLMDNAKTFFKGWIR
ncbi:MAG: TatD family hydrolase, partial [Desulfobacterales bacterium]|nr:TatD family hydrolase [Desulfobacterales bacterium]